MPTEQLSLPYEVISNVANRDYLRSNFKRAPRDSYFIELSKIEERENFNKRKVYEEIEELSESILAHGLQEPFWLNILSDGKALLMRGHRRWRAYKLLVEKGKFPADGLVEFLPVKSNVTEMQMLLDQHISNNLQKKMKPFERAAIAYELKHNFGEILSHEVIAEKMNISRQNVDLLIRIAEADDRMKQEMITADMNMKECLELVNSKKKLDQQSIKAEIEASKNEADPTPAPFDPNAKEAAELKSLEETEVDNQEYDLPFMEEQKEETPEEKEIREEKELKELLLIADEVVVKKLKHHLDKKLAAAVKEIELVDYVDEDTGETTSVPQTKFYLNKGTVISAEIIEQLQENKVKTVFLYKPGCEPVAPSVITEPVATKEKDRFDNGRPEIAQVNNCIKLADKIEAVVNKLDVPEGTKTDIANYVKWMQKDLVEVREYVHKHKDQNKVR